MRAIIEDIYCLSTKLTCGQCMRCLAASYRLKLLLFNEAFLVIELLVKGNLTLDLYCCTENEHAFDYP